MFPWSGKGSGISDSIGRTRKSVCQFFTGTSGCISGSVLVSGSNQTVIISEKLFCEEVQRPMEMKRYQIDRKRRRKLSEKKQAQGHHRDDQEPAQGIIDEGGWHGRICLFTEEQKQEGQCGGSGRSFQAGESCFVLEEKSAWPVITVLQWGESMVWSRDRKGSCAIDFVRMFYNQSFPDAVTMLLGGEQGVAYRESVNQQLEPKKPFVLPEANQTMHRAFAYLIKTRCVDPKVVSVFAGNTWFMKMSNIIMLCLWVLIQMEFHAMHIKGEPVRRDNHLRGM